MAKRELFTDPLQPCVYHVLLKVELICGLTGTGAKLFVRKKINLSCFPIISEFQNITNRNFNILGIVSGRLLE